MSYHQLNKSYIDLVNCRCIFCASRNSRYLLEIPFLNTKDGEEIIVIMLNPSTSAKAHVFYGVGFADLQDIDETTNNVLSVLKKGISLNNKKIQVSNVFLLNLFPYFSPSPKDLNTIDGVDAFEECINMLVVESCLREHKNSCVLVGWGKGGAGGIDKQIHKTAIKKVKDLLKTCGNNSYCYDKNNGFVVFNPKSRTMYVSHASRWR